MMSRLRLSGRVTQLREKHIRQKAVGGVGDLSGKSRRKEGIFGENSLTDVWRQK
jgi:hypothetical protein